MDGRLGRLTLGIVRIAAGSLEEGTLKRANRCSKSFFTAASCTAVKPVRSMSSFAPGAENFPHTPQNLVLCTGLPHFAQNLFRRSSCSISAYAAAA